MVILLPLDMTCDFFNRSLVLFVRREIRFGSDLDLDLGSDSTKTLND